MFSRLFAFHVATPQQDVKIDSVNEPITRLKNILSALEIDSDTIESYLFSRSEVQRAIEFVLTSVRVHSQAYMKFIRDAWPSANEAKDPHWYNVDTQTLVPYNFSPYNFSQSTQNTRLAPFLWAGVYGSDSMSPIAKDTSTNVFVSAYNTILAARKFVSLVFVFGSFGSSMRQIKPNPICSQL